MSYLKDLPCAGCGTESTYYFPDKPTAHYCYCEFRHEIGEQIAQEIEELPQGGVPSMPRYLVSYTETNVYSIEIISSDEDSAIEMAKHELIEGGIEDFDHKFISDSFFQVEGEV